MTKEQLDSFMAEMVRSRLFICVAVDDKGRSQEMFCGDPYKLIDVAFNALLSMIDELETTADQNAHDVPERGANSKRKSARDGESRTERNNKMLNSSITQMGKECHDERK